MSNTKSPDSDASSAPSTSSADTSEVAPTEPITSGGRWRILASVAAVIIVVDQVTKAWAWSSLQNRTIDLFWTARFRLIENFGSAFSLGSGLGRWLGVIVIAVVVAVLFYARKVNDRKMLLLFGGIVGGAIGNLIDRVVRAEDGFLSGGVVDFIDFQWWPVFNVADMAVVVSAVGLMLLSMREPS